jgi:hypothetical protein
MMLYIEQDNAEKEESITTKRSDFKKLNHRIHGMMDYFFLQKSK